jgi:AI-2 transport protein TqsA
VHRYDANRPAGELLQTSLLGAGSFVSTLFLVLVISAFIQLEAAMYRRKLARAFGGQGTVRTTVAALHDVQRYLAVKVATSLANGVLLGLWCWLWGVDSPLLWGVLAFVLNFIPVVGSIIAAIPPLLLSMADGGIGPTIGVGAGYLVVNIVVDEILEPRIMGRALGLSPLVILMAMLLWGFVLGPVGALLSIPLTMVVKILFEHDPELRRLALLMGDSVEPAKPG